MATTEATPRPPQRRRREVDGIILLDKPLSYSSNQALQRVKGMFRAAKAGHTGALDPLASGLLPICLGQATKLCGLLLDGDKRYEASARLGVRTASGDAESEAVAFSDPALLDETGLRAALDRFRGDILQRPPMHSAIKLQGRKLYTLAREGIEVERAARAVRIHELRLLGYDGASFSFEVHCSKGTYVRTLAEDIAAAAGQCAHLTALRRTAAAPFQRPAMVTLDALQDCVDRRDFPALRAHLRPAAEAVSGWQHHAASDWEARELAHGQFLPADARLQPGNVAVLNGEGGLIGLGYCEAGLLKPRRWFSRD